ncbi:lipid-A-disaccharide synthase [Prochlorococcus marinus]|uniref:Lipid-A-disaccharide synthase n=1 Tax=Prochlorococcus marinus XMU1408 TaxID=2213228 RepID=A0A318QWU4_PROMR|nr:lipid-A-disaccharide synthase [Prochlorococcus marinus]MBW3042518.1 lipid-A-disaccharide synthase [Prochlorococcus marinus str. XMU1408]PYE01246.1 lipid-A-disaccharide synthase [Prochlorococcus marinus XMU1408]
MRLLISTGEVSGDLQGSLLIKALKNNAEKRKIELEIIALGGERMRESGAKLISNTSSIGAIGFLEALPYVLPTLTAQSKVDNYLSSYPPDAVVLIDYMGPNIRLGLKVKKKFPNIPIIYYIAPQEWAWRLGDSGTTDLISFTDKILAIFEEEANFYSNKGGNVKFVGHPMLDFYRNIPTREESFREIGLTSDKKLLLIIPASRKQELKYILPTLLKAAKLLQQKDPSITVLIPSGLEEFDGILNNALNKYGVSGRIILSNEVDNLKPFLFSAAHLAFAKSGTINMELAINSVPQIVGYKVSRVTAFFARYLLRFNVKYISPVNLLLNKMLIPEFIQEDFKVEKIFNAALKIIEDRSKKEDIMLGYKRLKDKLGKPGVTDRASNDILDLLVK